MKRHHRVAGDVGVFCMSMFSLLARHQKENTVVLLLSSNPCIAAPTAHQLARTVFVLTGHAFALEGGPT